MIPRPPASNPPAPRARWVAGLVPLVLLAGLVALFLVADPLRNLRGDAPPVEELTITRAVLDERPRRIDLHVTNGGPEPVTVAQIQVDGAFWPYKLDGSRQIDRLGSRRVRIDYPWVDGETHQVVLLSSTGVAFAHEIPVAVRTPDVTRSTLLTFTLLGALVGVVPVLLGLLWLPFLSSLRPRWVNFFLALTAGLLVFLGAEAVHEALEVSALVPGALQGFGLVVLGVLLSIALLYGIGGWMRSRRGSASPFYVALLVALGIGLHNLGEGLAIGAAYSLGEVGLTSFLVLGFILHNTTEGLGIVAPLARERPSIGSLLLLGAIAGIPTIAGTWIGGLSYNPAAAVLFLSLGAGAIFQVV
ncbi:MAG TPA: ZIP family metal transporter, partial [Actinomycetota bacterium]|nr:ZIP family metal transporter [Actinomycetota bacterium]